MQSSTRESNYGKPTVFRKISRILREYPVVPILIILLVLVLPAVAAEWIAPHNPVVGDRSVRLQPPAMFGGTWEYPLGTDRLGRDVFSRVIYGARISLYVALSGIFFGGVFGTTIGLIAGYYGGWRDALVMRVVETMMSIPLILLGLVFALAIGPGYQTTILVVSLVLWSYYARQVRGEVLRVREYQFVDRARVAGASDLRIIVRHILPNVVNTLIVLATLQVAVVIIMESTLSFLGLGLPRPQPAWGIMVADGRTMIVLAWWISFFPGLAILLTVMSLNIFGDWLRDRLDPRLRQV